MWLKKSKTQNFKCLFFKFTAQVMGPSALFVAFFFPVTTHAGSSENVLGTVVAVERQFTVDLGLLSDSCKSLDDLGVSCFVTEFAPNGTELPLSTRQSDLSFSRNTLELLVVTNPFGYGVQIRKTHPQSGYQRVSLAEARDFLREAFVALNLKTSRLSSFFYMAR